MRPCVVELATLAFCARLAVLAVPAHAMTACATSGPGCDSGNIELSVPVTASIGGACSFAPGGSPSGSQNVGDVAAVYAYDFPFTLECTVPLRMAVVSSNGGLLAPGSPAPGYTALAPYQVKLFIQGGTASVTDTCDASLLTLSAPGGCSFRGTASASVGLRLSDTSYDVPGSYLRVSSAGYAGSPILIASNGYADTLTVTLSVAP